MREIAKRLSLYLMYKNLSGNAFSVRIGINQSNLSKMLNGKQPISEKTLYKISSTFPELNMEWLRTGEGEMLRRKEEGEVLKVPLQPARSQSNTNSPGAVNLAENAIYNHYSSPPVGMRVEGVVEGVRPIVPTGLAQQKDIDVYTEVKKLGTERVEFFSYIPEFPDTDMYMRMQDDSMMPHLERGDILAIAALDESTYIMNGNVYALDTRRMGLFVRLVNDHGDSYECQTYTEQLRYHPFSVPKSDVIRIYRITGMFRPCV